MKIEKISENQIRCTLTHADLAARHLKLSELAYGTEKAKNLFRDMIQQASFDFGFEADDLPLMIEAIPASSDSIVLIITKVEDPEELDTRFSKFTSFGNSESGLSEPFNKLEGADEIFELLDKVKEAAAALPSDYTPAEGSVSSEHGSDNFPVRLFLFTGIDRVIQAARLISSVYQGENALYYNEETDQYVLALMRSEDTGNDFNKICNTLSEYGTPEKASRSTLAYLEEHWETAVPDNAIQHLSEI